MLREALLDPARDPRRQRLDLAVADKYGPAAKLTFQRPAHSTRHDLARDEFYVLPVWPFVSENDKASQHGRRTGLSRDSDSPGRAAGSGFLYRRHGAYMPRPVLSPVRDSPEVAKH